MRPCIVFDIGGTSLRAGLYAPHADRVDAVEICATPNHLAFPDWDSEQILARLVEEIAALVRQRAQGSLPPRIGLALPGPIDSAGNIGQLPTILGAIPYTPFPFKQRLEAQFPGAHVALLNDVTAAGYGLVEADLQEFCLITVSSGIGHKVFVDGEPVVGKNGAGGELGHWRVDPGADALRCECGGPGHLAAVASGRAVLHSVQRAAAADAGAFRRSHLFEPAQGQPEGIDNPAIVAAFHARDPWVTGLVDRAARALGQAIAAVHLIVGTERFAIMGGFGEALGPRFCALLSAAAADFSWGDPDRWSHRIHLVPPERPIALLGAGRYASRHP